MPNTTIDIMGRRAAFLPASALHQLNRAIEALIALVDELAPDCDLEEDDPPGEEGGHVDLEPNLGATEVINQDKAWKAAQADTDLEFDGEGVADADLEDGNDREGIDEDSEPSLGATVAIDQSEAWRNYSAWGDDDRESDGCEDELPATPGMSGADSAAVAAEKRRFEEQLRRQQSDDVLEYGRMFRPDEDVRMPDGTRIMGYVR